MTDDQINEKIARYLFSLKGLDYDAEVKELQGVTEDVDITGPYGGCDTCGWGGEPGSTDFTMIVTYVKPNGRRASMYVDVSYADCLLYLLKDTPNAY